MTTTFEGAKIGDRVWCLRLGWGEIRDTGQSARYPIHVCFPNGEFATYTAGGLHCEDNINQTLFWGEVVIDAPEKPLPDLEVDAKVLVWDRPEVKRKMHFSHFKDGQIVTFKDGKTSFTTCALACWPHWELAD